MKVVELFKKTKKDYKRPRYINPYDINNWIDFKDDSYSNGDTIKVYLDKDFFKNHDIILPHNIYKGFLVLSSDPFSQSFIYNSNFDDTLCFWIGDRGLDFYESNCLLLEKRKNNLMHENVV
jgi:hypothetical protein